MEYLQWYLHKTPNLEKIQSCGVHLPYQRSSFPTVTLANHYSMATGLYPESHGIVDNHFVDTKFMEEYGKNQSDSKWYDGEPIWNTVQKSNKTSAVLYWFPSQAKVNDMYANYWYEYSQDFPFEDRVKRLLNWVDGKEADDSEKDLETGKPDLIMGYFPEPDHTGHETGPYNSTKIENMLGEIETR